MHRSKTVSLFSLALCVALCAACGDDEPMEDPDAGVEPDASPLPSAVAFAVAGDYQATGVASTVDIPELTVQQNVIAGVAGEDPVVRYADGRIYVINRFGTDNITILDAESMSFVSQISTGAGSNPQDLAVSGTTLYVAAMGTVGVLVLDSAQPEAGVIRTIDLSSFDPGDGIPDCRSITIAGDNLLVACGTLDPNWTPIGPAKIAVIDMQTEAFTSFDLSTPNVYGPFLKSPADSALGGDLIVSTVLFPDYTSGCIERISLDPAPSPAGCVVDNTDLGGFAGSYQFADDGSLYAAVTTGWDNGPAASVVAYDFDSDTVDPNPISQTDRRFFDLARCPTGHWVFVDANGGLRVYGADGVEMTQNVLDIGLPPVQYGVVCF